MPYIPGMGPAPALPLEGLPRPATAPDTRFDAIMDRLAPPQGQAGPELPEIVKPAMTIEAAPAGRPIAVGPLGPGAVVDAGKLFRPMADFLGEVNAMALASGELQERFAAGENVELHDVMIAAEKAGVAVNLTTQIRNRLLEAYQEIARMPV